LSQQEDQNDKDAKQYNFREAHLSESFCSEFYLESHNKPSSCTDHGGIVWLDERILPDGKSSIPHKTAGYRHRQGGAAGRFRAWTLQNENSQKQIGGKASKPLQNL
jgi:hypothetical protein